MIIAMVAVSVVVIASCVVIAIVRIRRQRTPSDLRGNWWADFERQFRDYEAARRHRRAGRGGRGDNPAKGPPTN
jgi:hypothetical protein